jgi:Ca-activated chloride channel family protein
MTFASPLVLVLLFVLPLLGCLYMAGQSAGSRRASFATPRMTASVQPNHPGWRRHVPVIALLAAMAILILACARPQRSVAVPVEQASIMLATDVSGSMSTKDIRPNRLAAAKSAVHSFLGKVPPRMKVGIMAFNQTPTVLQSPTTDRQAANSAVDAMKISGATASGDAVRGATRALRAGANRRNRPPAAIVLMSDGESTRGSDPVQAARAARAQGVRVYTVSLGTGAGTDPATLRRMAEVSRGEFFTAADAAGLKNVYEHLGSQLSITNEKRQVTAWFVGGGLLALFAAGSLSLRWFGRLV